MLGFDPSTLFFCVKSMTLFATIPMNLLKDFNSEAFQKIERLKEEIKEQSLVRALAKVEAEPGSSGGLVIKGAQ